MKNVWLGLSIKNQKFADSRHDELEIVALDGWNTFVSYEPALDNVNWIGWEFIKWLIVGGESGPKSRPMDTEWTRNARDWAVRNGVAFFFKQWGGRNKKRAGRLLDGVEWNEYPEGMK